MDITSEVQGEYMVYKDAVTGRILGTSMVSSLLGWFHVAVVRRDIPGVVVQAEQIEKYILAVFSDYTYEQ